MKFDLQKLSPAEKLLWNNGVLDKSHIDLDALAYRYNAEIRYRPLDGCEARLVTYGERAIISISSSSTDGRKRFSLAHELAHWICDKRAGSFLCAKEDIGPQNSEAKTIESNANDFASQLILPDYLVTPWMEGKKITLDVASILATDFSSSLTAAAIKLIKKASAPACIACYNQSRMIWYQKNSKFPWDMYLAKELHQDTEAFQMAYSEKSGMTRPKREPATRWFTGKEVYKLEVESQSIKLPDNTVLTVLAQFK